MFLQIVHHPFFQRHSRKIPFCLYFPETEQPSQCQSSQKVEGLGTKPDCVDWNIGSGLMRIVWVNIFLNMLKILHGK